MAIHEYLCAALQHLIRSYWKAAGYHRLCQSHSSGIDSAGGTCYTDDTKTPVSLTPRPWGRGLFFVLMPSLVRLKFLREQGAQQLEDNPQHGGADEGENEQEHQHNGGVDEELNHSQSAFPNRSFRAYEGLSCSMAQEMKNAAAAIRAKTAAAISRKYRK